MSNSQRSKDDGPSPKLRFPEFDGKKLHAIRLGEVTDEPSVRNRGKLPTESVMGVRKDDGIVPMQERLVAADTSRYKVVKHDWFAYNPMRLNIGSIARWRGKEDVLVSPDYVVFRCRNSASPTGLLPTYLDHFRQTKQWESFVTGSGDGGVRVRIYYRDLAQMRVLLPDFAEQKKIAAALSSIDELIDAEDKRLQQLREYKRGLLQRLFPAPGEATPRLRLPEFAGAGKWRETRLRNLGDLVSGLTYKPSDVRVDGLLVLRSSNIQDGEIDLADQVFVVEDVAGKNRVKADDILICVRNGSTSLIGKNALIPRGLPPCTHGAFMTIFRSKSAAFVFQLFQTHSYQKQVAADLGATINSINGNNFLKYKFFVPDENEQRHIGEFLSSVDDLIRQQKQKVEALRNHKMGLSQRIMPIVDESV